LKAFASVQTVLYKQSYINWCQICSQLWGCCGIFCGCVCTYCDSPF